jgi:hypothetical protein
MDIQQSIVAILNVNDEIVGTGFLAGKNLLLTCAHVVKLAGSEPSNLIKVRFQKDNLTRAASVEVTQEELDVAVLRLDSLPGDIIPLPLGSAVNSLGHEFHAYGYAIAGNVRGIGARGRIIELVDSGRWLQISSQEPDHGMSGAPVFDEMQQSVVGMISWGTPYGKRNRDTTFAISIEIIQSFCTDLRNKRVLGNPFGFQGRLENLSRYLVRQPLTNQIFDEIRKGQSISIVAGSQMGKSSLLWYLCQVGPQKIGCEFAYFDLELVSNENEFFEGICEELNISTSRGFWFAHALKERHIVLCLDEIEKMTWRGFSRDLRSQLRGLADGTHAPLQLVISSRTSLRQLFPDDPTNTSPLAGLCFQIDLVPFTLTETKNLVARYLGSDASLPSEVVENAWLESGGHPARLQKELHNAWNKIFVP